jgi:uncharacterized protein (TIGR02145 family)
MENSENKSLISTGSSNLAKTKKLLSITQKILSEIKPQYESVRIGDQEWMTRNLDVDRFRNGDLIPHIESNEEWKKAGENGQPAWCYYDNDHEYGKKYGKLYNWYAVNDPRGLAPKGWRVPSNEEWTTLINFLGGKEVAGHKMKSDNGWNDWEDNYGEIKNGNGDDSFGFNALPGGARGINGSFRNVSINAFFWSATQLGRDSAWRRGMNGSEEVSRHYYFGFKSSGASFRCLRN